MENRVFVINQHGKALMPCKPSTARKYLRDGKAVVLRKQPCTIQLTVGVSGYKQLLQLGVDTANVILE